MEIKLEKDEEKGLKKKVFVDLNNEKCCIEDSSLTEPAVRLGVNNFKMHLTKDMVVALLPHLIKFITDDRL